MPILAIALTVFLDLLAFGLFIPDLQLRGRELGASGLSLGILQGIFSFSQLIFSPILGRISDKYGRRQVLLITTLLSAASYVVYAHVNTIFLLGAARFVCGMGGASVSVAFAYVADVTTAENRTKGLGIVGAALGLGFVVGPGVGTLLLWLGHDKPLILGYTGAVLAVVNFIYVYKVLPKARPTTMISGGESPMKQLLRALEDPSLRGLLFMSFFIVLAFSNFETTFFQLLASPGWIYHLTDMNARNVGGILLTVVGITSAFVQGYVVRKYNSRIGEVRALRYSYLVFIPCIALLPFAHLWVPMVLLLIVLAFAMGMASPNLSSLISQNAPSNLQGSVFGVSQSMQAFARILGPLIANSLFIRVIWTPYLLGSILMLLPMSMAWRLKEPAMKAENFATIS